MLLLGDLRAARAGEPTDQIRAHIGATYEAQGAAVSAPSPSRMASVRKVADQMFDWSAMAREALGDHWAKRNTEQRNEFARLFVNLFEDGYFSKIRLAEANGVRSCITTLTATGAASRAPFAPGCRNARPDPELPN